MELGNEKADWKHNIKARLRSLELILLLWRNPHQSWPGSLDITANFTLSHMWSFLWELPPPAPLPGLPPDVKLGLPSLQQIPCFHFRFHVFIQIVPHPFSCQPPSDIWRNCYCKPALSCRCPHTFVINIVNQSNTTCFVSFVHMQSTYSYKDMRKTSD